ncbi:MAG: methyltransferase domain-containing protein [Candidatus Electrothrix sp. AR5]|nr:methyltransferase domain-containing protein [Candidatus Electrothrix sp. AR5]
MTDHIIVYGDLKRSESYSIKQINHIITIVSDQLDIKQKIWGDTRGDAFCAVFDSANIAIEYALKVRDKLRFFDWRSKGISRPPQFRIAITSGPTESTKYNFQDYDTLIGIPFIKAVRVEAIVVPGEVWVTPAIFEIFKSGNESSEIGFIDLGAKKLPKNSGEQKLYSVHWSKEAEGIKNGYLGPLKDDQYYYRENSLRKFVFLWLLLDQLPRGSWGRSVPIWMKEVWRDMPTFSPSTVMEDEGGFETTILNIEFLGKFLGPKDFLQTEVWRKAFRYLMSRYNQGGFGTISYSRHGYELDPHPRHSALVTWMLGTVFGKEVPQIAEFKTMFRVGVLSLLGESKEKVLETYIKDRNPLMLYLSTWNIIKLLENPELRNLFENDQLQSIHTSWDYTKNQLIDAALKTNYEEKAQPLLLSSGKDFIAPLTVPYGNFVRMESYSLLSAVMLLDSEMPTQIKQRLGSAIKHIAEEYLKKFNSSQQRYTTDSLRPINGGRGITPFFTNPAPSPDFGSTAMLYRVLRSKKIIHTLWGGKPPIDTEKICFLLNEDMVEFFDRYLVEPRLFKYTHPGMLAGILDEDKKNLTEEIISVCMPYTGNKLSVELTGKTVNNVLSEEKIENIIETIIAKTTDGTNLQLATHSISRLLLDLLRPGRYVQEKIDIEAKRYISQKTLDVYNNNNFAAKFDKTWGGSVDQAIVTPFLIYLKEIGAKTILDIGCGPGQYAQFFVKEGFDVDLLDGSNAFLEIAKQKINKSIKPTCYHINVIDDMERGQISFTTQYDAIWCSALLVHVPQKNQIELINWFKGLLSPHGILFCNFMLNNPRVFGRDGRYYTFSDSSKYFEVALEECGFKIEQALIKSTSMNTYQEPFLVTEWANYYSRKKSTPKNNLNIINQASFLTSLAYQRSVTEFVRAHQSVSLSKSRQHQIDNTIGELENLLPKHVLCPKILDVGCGLGDFVYSMSEKNWDAIGIDISYQTVEWAKKHAPSKNVKDSFFVYDILELPVEFKNFDGIICITMFQHIPIENEFAAKVLSKLASILNPGGILRFDIQLHRKTGFDPDLRFIQGYKDKENARKILNFDQFNLEEIATNHWELPIGKNSFKRDIDFQFIDFWLRKKMSNT